MATLKSINPFTLKQISEFPELTDVEIAGKIIRSGEQFIEYRNSSFAVRKSRMHKVAALLKARKGEYARTITAEMGKLIGEAESEVEKCAWVCEYYADRAELFLSERVIGSDARRSSVICQPIGPVLAVMPWNFPFWQVFRFAAPALMAGNTALLKHASNVQGCAAAIENVFFDAGFEPHVFQNLAISSSKVQQVIEHPGVKAVTLTGSTAAGAAVASVAGRHIKKSVLELGGSNAFVVLKDADLEKAADTAMTARLINAGQSCIAAKRFILEKEIHDDFVGMLKERVEKLRQGDPADRATTLAPLFSGVQAEEIDTQVKDSIEAGATLVTGGARHRTFYEATILTGVQPGMAVFDEETFGPVFAVTEAADREHALALSNQSEFGLGMQVFTQSEASAELFIREANEGSVFVNGLVKSDPRLPFGGVKTSGYGRELSEEGIREFVNIKTIWKG
jgi:succinate-semialdehyde dehydrogenase/glutarate-semialdehyde dehydrogenase